MFSIAVDFKLFIKKKHNKTRDREREDAPSFSSLFNLSRYTYYISFSLSLLYSFWFSLFVFYVFVGNLTAPTELITFWHKFPVGPGLRGWVPSICCCWVLLDQRVIPFRSFTLIENVWKMASNKRRWWDIPGILISLALMAPFSSCQVVFSNSIALVTTTGHRRGRRTVRTTSPPLFPPPHLTTMAKNPHRWKIIKRRRG